MKTKQKEIKKLDLWFADNTELENRQNWRDIQATVNELIDYVKWLEDRNCQCWKCKNV